MILVEGLRKSFADVRAVDGVDVTVEQGEILVLLGQNGAGKSTTLRCLGGILRPDAGLIELDGLRLPESLDAVRLRLGVVPDQARLYGRNTATEYLDRFGYLYGVSEKIRRERIAALLERFELADRSGTILAAYSRGMAQKVALIRATIHEPDWIFCDEPTAGLDPVAAADMRHYLGEQKSRGAALVVTTHVLAGIRASQMFASLREQGDLLRHSLPFYVSSWWRRGDLSWVMYLNAFVLLLVAGTSLFGQLPGAAGQVAQRIAGGSALQAGLLLPLFFMSFALLESIKSSIGIWWEKAQGSLEVLLYAPLDDPSLIWLEVLPGAVVSTVWVTLWMAAGMALLSLFGQTAPWDLLPVFAFVAVVTAYWAAMGRMLGFMLFPREGAAGGAWSFLLSPVSAAVADLPLALFVFRSPLAIGSLLLPLTACFALTVLCGATFDRERLMETGIGTRRPRRIWLPIAVIRRNAAAIAAGVLIAAASAGIAGTISANG